MRPILLRLTLACVVVVSSAIQSAPLGWSDRVTGPASRVDPRRQMEPIARSMLLVVGFDSCPCDLPSRSECGDGSGGGVFGNADAGGDVSDADRGGPSLFVWVGGKG